MGFDPATAIWAANKAADIVGGEGGASGGFEIIRFDDYGISVTGMFASNTKEMAVDSTITDEIFSRIASALASGKTVLFQADYSGASFNGVSGTFLRSAEGNVSFASCLMSLRIFGGWVPLLCGIDTTTVYVDSLRNILTTTEVTP